MTFDPTTIASRKSFAEELADARAKVQRFAEVEPNNPVWFHLAMMLDTMAVQTEGGREPTLEERRATRLGALVDRELEPNVELEALSDQLKALHLYFIVWPDDGVDPDLMPEEELIARL